MRENMREEAQSGYRMWLPRPLVPTVMMALQAASSESPFELSSL